MNDDASAKKNAARKTRLNPGQHSIDRVNPTPPATPGGSYVLRWSMRDSQGVFSYHTSKAPTKGELRRRALARFNELMQTSGTGTWKTTDPIARYIDEVSAPAVEKAPLEPNSRRRYRVALRQLAGECCGQHVDSLGRLPIASATRFRALEKCLQEVARIHGSESARQCRTVLSKYVIQQLIRDQLITGNPLRGMFIDLSNDASSPDTQNRDVVSLTQQQWDAVVAYLIALDPAEGVPPTKRGRWTHADRVRLKRNAIDLTLLQAATGLRFGEANKITWDRHVEVAKDGAVNVTVTREISKTHRARTIGILDDRVAARILERQNRAQAPTDHVIGAPSDPSKVWEERNARSAVEDVYTDAAHALGIPELLTPDGGAHTHVWRATLNTLLMDKVPDVVRAAWFGHTTAVNDQAYTDLTNVSGMIAAGRRLHLVASEVA